MGLVANLVAPSVPWVDLIPLLVLLGGTAFLLLVGAMVPSWPRHGYAYFTSLIAAAGIVASAVHWNDLYYEKGQTVLADVLAFDRFTVFGTVVILAAVILASLQMSVHLGRNDSDGPELYALFLTSAIGGIVMIAANELIVLFLGLEVLSLSLYLMTASNRRRDESQESGLKYFILGGFASAFLLYGIAFVYGTTGSTNYTKIAEELGGQVSIINADALLLVGIGLMLVGMAFKVSAAPFHVWAPDVYEGAPTPVTAYMASAGKVAAFAAMLRILLVALNQRVDDWRPIIWVLAILTVFMGSIVAVVQTNVKRMLAYSSISHAGFILVGVEAASHPGSDGLTSTMAYLAIYTVLVMGSFAIVLVISGNSDSATSLDDFKGLAKRRPALALAFSTLLFAQAGVPFTSGFVAKFGVIKSGVESDSYVLAIAAMVAAVIGAFLYLRITVSMWLEEPASTDTLVIPRLAAVVITFAVAFTLVVGIVPDVLLNAARLVRFAPL
jgi:NADH-quinone oxidoreductase subunit N